MQLKNSSIGVLESVYNKDGEGVSMKRITSKEAIKEVAAKMALLDTDKHPVTEEE